MGILSTNFETMNLFFSTLFCLFLSVYAQFPYTPLSIGNEFHRSFGLIRALPMNRTAAVAQGWRPYENALKECTPGKGEMYFYKSFEPSTKYPIGLGFTPFGQLASMSVYVKNADVDQKLVDNGWWIRDTKL